MSLADENDALKFVSCAETRRTAVALDAAWNEVVIEVGSHSWHHILRHLRVVTWNWLSRDAVGVTNPIHTMVARLLYTLKCTWNADRGH